MSEVKMGLLPINLDDLIHARSVESLRIEFKTTWNDQIKLAVCKTICAFANDFLNLNGGYIIIGISTIDGKPQLPPVGLDGLNIEQIQREIRVIGNKIDPEYQPIVVPEIYQDKSILVVYAPAGDNRPYSSPDDRNPKERAWFIRIGGESIKASGDNLRRLMELTAKTPFDDRRNLQANLLNLSPILVKRYLSEVKSDLLNNDPPLSDEELYKALGIVKPEHNTLIPTNCGLMFFSEHPENHFAGCKYEVVQFGDDAGGNLIEEKTFTGPLNIQIESVLDYLDNITNVQLLKVPGKAKVERTVAYPYEALEETIVNAAYHRGYDSIPEPNKVYLYPDRVEIVSYPGPVAGIKKEHFVGNHALPPVPARNRKIGTFLKELRLAEMRGTGIPKIKRTMRDNGSPEPIIEFDDECTYFKVTLPAHPRYIIVHSLRESAYLWSVGEKKSAIELLKKSFEIYPNSGAVAGQLIDYYYSTHDLEKADEIFKEFKKLKIQHEPTQPFIRYFKLLINDDNVDKAKSVINSIPDSIYEEDMYEIAIAFKRVGTFDRAHTLLSRIYPSYEQNPDYLQSYAQVKLKIADLNYKSPTRNWAVMRRLRADAIELLHKAIYLYKDDNNKSWSWFALARALQFSKSMTSKVDEAFEMAIKLNPGTALFREKYAKWKEFSKTKRATLDEE